jgi:hypothetical protein
VAEGGGLLNRYTGQNLYRGFESPPLRQRLSYPCVSAHLGRGFLGKSLIIPRMEVPASSSAATRQGAHPLALAIAGMANRIKRRMDTTLIRLRTIF